MEASHYRDVVERTGSSEVTSEFLHPTRGRSTPARGAIGEALG
jgi:hypothetical protein